MIQSFKDFWRKYPQRRTRLLFCIFPVIVIYITHIIGGLFTWFSDALDEGTRKMSMKGGQHVNVRFTV